MNIIHRYDRFELELTGPSEGNPFVDVETWADFSHGNRTVTVRGFYDGDGRHKVRFMPDEGGEWSYRTRSSASELDGQSGAFTVSEPKQSAVGSLRHGPVQAVGTAFCHADRTPYLPIGTTCYAWVHQPAKLRDQTVRTLSQNAFTKIRMCAFPKEYRYNKNEPDHFVFPGSLEAGFDFNRFNPVFFATFEDELDRLSQLGIDADIILFHPYDRWGFQSMPEEVDERYLRYVVARWASFPNVWWSMANEWDLMKHKTVQDFHRYFRTVQREDPYNHPRSCHNWHSFYDHSLPWVTHASIQRSDTERTAEWLQTYHKPIVIDECCYEGDVNEGWGNISGQELLRRQWTAFIYGGWPGAHGETFYNEEEVLWWSKGGKLTGEAPARLRFMRTILEDAPLTTLGVCSLGKHTPTLASGEDYFVFYLGFQRAAWKDIHLPENKSYRAEVIDTWEMTVTELEGVFSGECVVHLPAREYIAVRFRAEQD